MSEPIEIDEDIKESLESDDSGEWVWFDPVKREWVTVHRLDQVKDFLKYVPTQG
jgi:hypothetical protein